MAKFKTHIKVVIVIINIGSMLKNENIRIETDPFSKKSKTGNIGTTEVNAYIEVMLAIASI